MAVVKKRKKSTFFAPSCCVLLPLCVYGYVSAMTTPLLDRDLTQLRNRMYRFACSILGNPAEAEDATHDTLEKLWRRRDELALCRNVEAFALTALRNACIDRIRRRHEGRCELRESLSMAKDEVEQWSSKELVRVALARLPLRQREVLHLKEIEGYATYEIAEMIGVAENQVRTILSRARHALREAVEALMQERR